MTLRSRLVGGLVLLMAIGLAIFGFAMYELYSGSQYSQLHGELRNAVPLVTQELAQEAGFSLAPPRTNGPGGPASTQPAGTQPAGTQPAGKQQTSGPPPLPGGAAKGSPPPANSASPARSVLVAPGTYGELLNEHGAVIDYVRQVSGSSQPRISPALLAKTTQPQVLYLGSISGGTRWLTDIAPRSGNGDRVVVALPTTQVTGSLHRLVLIEVLCAASLLLVLSAGAGLVLRRGLSPLERMAGTAKQIAGGDLSQRVEAPQGTEVGQLALAFNTMLDEIQQAFAARDGTEDRLRQFLADASHELRTPLTSIHGFAQLFRLGQGDPRVDSATIMRRVEEESARMKGLVEDLLLLARLDQVRSSEQEPVDLAVLAADACSDAIAAEKGRPVTLTAPQPVVVLGDEAHLRQALANLVANALRHTPAGSAVEVSATLEGGVALVEVRDHGPGLDEEALAHAFDRFWQKDPARAGAGLGLAIVAAVAAEHGGSVSAANAPGGGALFSTRLPLAGRAPQPCATGRSLPGRREPEAVADAPHGVDEGRLG